MLLVGVLVIFQARSRDAEDLSQYVTTSFSPPARVARADSGPLQGIYAKFNSNTRAAQCTIDNLYLNLWVNDPLENNEIHY